MGKSTYKITAIRPGMNSKYDEFWKQSKKVSEDGTPLTSDLVATTDLLEAKNSDEAESIAKLKFPNHTIIVSRIG